MALDSILDQLSKHLNVPLSLDEQQTCHFQINQRYSATLESSLVDDSFFLYAPVCKVEKGSEKALFSKALEGNLFGLHTGDASFGFDSDTNSLILFQKFPGNIEYEDFFSSLESFINYQRFWLEEVEGILGADFEYGNTLKSKLGQQNLRVFIA